MEIKKLYYTMGEVAEMFDVSTSLIRYWEKHFTIIKPERNKKGNRLFTPADVENFKKIYHLVKERGMTLEGAKKSLRGASGAEINREVELMDRLLKIRSLLLEVRQELKEEDDEKVIDEPQEQEQEQPVLLVVEPQVVVELPAEEPKVDDMVAAPKSHPRVTPPDGEDKELFAYYEQKLF